MPPSLVAPRECAVLLLSTIPQLMRTIAGCSRHLKPAGEQPVRLEYVQLLHILAHSPCSLRELAARHHVTPSTMSRTVDVLVQRGWITRQADARDRRQVVISLTEPGRATLAAMGESVRESLTELLGQLEVEECGRLYDGLQALSSLLTRIEGMVQSDHPHGGPSPGTTSARPSGAPTPVGNRGPG